jgi:hypothetical protein
MVKGKGWGVSVRVMRLRMELLVRTTVGCWDDFRNFYTGDSKVDSEETDG